MNDMMPTILGAIGAIISFLATVIVTIITWVVKTHVTKLEIVSKDINKHDETIMMLKGRAQSDDKSFARLEDDILDLSDSLKEHESRLIKIGTKLDLLIGNRNND